MKHVIYQPEGVCSRKIDFDLTDEGTIANCRFSGGCSGNLLAISKLIEGQKATDIVRVLLGNHCADNPPAAPINSQEQFKKIFNFPEGRIVL